MSISFSSAARTEICRELPHKPCCARAQCFGILLFCNSFQDSGIKIITESREFACILPKLFKKAFDLDFGKRIRWQESWMPSGSPWAIPWRCM